MLSISAQAEVESRPVVSSHLIQGTLALDMALCESPLGCSAHQLVGLASEPALEDHPGGPGKRWHGRSRAPGQEYAGARAPASLAPALASHAHTHSDTPFCVRSRGGGLGASENPLRDLSAARREGARSDGHLSGTRKDPTSSSNGATSICVWCEPCPLSHTTFQLPTPFHSLHHCSVQSSWNPHMTSRPPGTPVAASTQPSMAPPSLSHPLRSRVSHSLPHPSQVRITRARWSCGGMVDAFCAA